jgi:OFA family oxalate/formate antiporter-like MFS transporter
VDINKRKILLLSSGSLILLFMGLIYSWSILAIPLEREFSWTRDKTSIIFVFAIIFFTFGLILTGFISKYFSPKICVRIAGLLICAGFVRASFSNTIGGMCFGYSFLCGLGIGITYNTVLTSTLLWFPEKTGFASGFLLGGYGLGGFILGPAVSRLINSDFGWRNTFLVLGFLYLILIMTESFIIQRPDEAGTPGIRGEAEPDRDKKPACRDVPPQQMLTIPLFKWFFLWGTVIGSCTVGIIGIGALFAVDIGAGTTLAAIIAGFISIGNGGGRIAFGLMYDHYGRRSAMVLIMFLFLTGVILLMVVFFSPNYFFLIAGYLLTGLSCGGMPAVYSCVCKKQFGDRHFSYNIAIFNATNVPCVFIGNYAAGIIRTRSGSYLPVLIGMIGFCVLAFLIHLRLERYFKDRE